MSYTDDFTPTEPPKEQVAPEERPIDRLRPGSDLHLLVLTHLKDRLDYSEREMARHYARWQVNEKRVQAYIDLPDYEKVLKEISSSGKAPAPVSVVIPYSFATISSIVTYLLHTFVGRRPMFPVGTHKEETVEAARMMETVLQYNADRARMAKQFWQFLWDGQTYGVSALRCQWRNEYKKRTVWKQQGGGGFLNLEAPAQSVKTKEERLVFQGNEVLAIDPFLFFPDPRVPMNEVNKRGEFVFWRTFSGKHAVRLAESAGEIKWASQVSPQRASFSESAWGGDSNRSLRAGGNSNPGQGEKDTYQVDQGTIVIIPKDLGLGDSEVPEKWIFTILNKEQIVQAEPFDADHDMHPVVVSEPYTLGNGFGHMGMADLLAPMQDTMSWFVNSHVHNVRAAINNMFVVDPSKVELQDFRNPEPGGIIRLKQAAYGQDVKTAIQQLPVTDVTGGHVKDMQLFMRLGQELSAITDNLKGLQDSGGRKTATEVRTSMEAASSRLAALARFISAQAIVDLTEMMALNVQQYQEMEFYLQIVGQEGVQTPITIGPEMLVGDFHFPVHDGTLPIDKVAMLDVWKEILMAVQGDQELRMQYSLPKIFEWVAELGGARNIEAMRLQVQPMPDQMAAQQAQMGNLAPLGGPGQMSALAALGGAMG